MSDKTLPTFKEKRLAYFKKAAQNYDWVRLGSIDAEIFEEILNNNRDSNIQYYAGFQDGYDACFLEHGPTIEDEEAAEVFDKATEEFLNKLNKKD